MSPFKKIKANLKRASQHLVQADVILRSRAIQISSEVKGDIEVVEDKGTLLVRPETRETEYMKEEFGSTKKKPKYLWKRAFDG